jgi:catechol 2,3-dioxygenase
MEYGIRPPGYRLPDATRIGRVVLQVSDLARSLEYYEVVLGLRVIDRSPTRATLGPHGDDPAILELRERKGARAVPRRGLLGLYHFAILVPDRPTLGRFVGHLASLGVQPGMSDHFVSEAIYLQDPDNLGIEVYRDRPRSEWRQENGQLSMTTIPLDVKDLLVAGGKEDWAGMPGGTRIGHVHLHVGDIDQAAAFYHDALGLDKQVWNYPGALFLSAGGYHHHLGTNTWARGAPSASDDDARLIEWQLLLPAASDVDAAASSLERAAKVQRERGSIVVADPWGTRLRVIGE